MKTVRFNKLILLTLTLGVLFSCVQDDDFDVPSSIGEEPELPAEENIVSISSVLNQAAQSEEQYTYEETNLYMEGYVVSSDEGGNFFRELILQDKPENPTAGIRLGLFVNPLYTKYNFGRKIYVGLDGFSVGTSNGVVTLGIPDGNFMDEAPAAFEDKIIRGSEVATIVPLTIEIADFSDEYENLFVKIENLQFPADIALGDDALTFAGESFDEFDGERTVESCANDNTFVLSTSTFADFKSTTLPAGSGSISGVLSRNFEDTFYVVSINDLSDINFDSEERCDPVTFDCGNADTEGTTVLFEDDFQSQSAGAAVSGNGWTNYSEAGTNPWEIFSDSDNVPTMGKGAKVDPYQSDDTSTISWLITPEIDFDAQEGETITFKTSNSFSDESNLRVLISTDWDGTEENIENATWGNLSSATIVSDDDFYKDVIDSGIVDLSCVEGTGYIAFKYIGSGNSNQDGTYELDDVKIAY